MPSAQDNSAFSRTTNLIYYIFHYGVLAAVALSFFVQNRLLAPENNTGWLQCSLGDQISEAAPSLMNILYSINTFVFQQKYKPV